jgi:hypothetical protein
MEAINIKRPNAINAVSIRIIIFFFVFIEFLNIKINYLGMLLEGE